MVGEQALTTGKGKQLTFAVIWLFLFLCFLVGV